MINFAQASPYSVCSGRSGEVLGKVSEQEVLDGIMRHGYNVKMEEIINIHNP